MGRLELVGRWGGIDVIVRRGCGMAGETRGEVAGDGIHFEK